MFLRDSIHTFSIRIAGYLSALLIQVMIARSLGPESKGELQIAFFLLTAVLMVVGLGFERAIIFFLGNGKYPLQTVWSNAWAYLLWGVCIEAIVFVPVIILARPWFGTIHGEVLMLALLIVPVELLFALQLGFGNGLGELRRGNLFSLSGSLLYLSLTALFVLGVWRASVAVLCAYLIAFLASGICMAFYWGRRNALAFRLQVDRPLLKDFVRYGVQGQIGNLTTLISTRLDIIILNYYMGKTSAGVYSAAINFAELMLFLPLVLTYVIFPHAARRNEAEAWKLLARVARVSTALNLLTAGGIALLAPLLIQAIFGSSFAGAVAPLRILLPGMVLLASLRVIATGISGAGHPIYFSVCTLISVSAALGLNLLWVPRYHETGAALATTLAHGLAFVALLLIVKFRFRFPWRELLVAKREDLTAIRSYLIGMRGQGRH